MSRQRKDAVAERRAVPHAACDHSATVDWEIESRPIRSDAADDRYRTSALAAELEHELVVLSRHRTSEGVVTYARCTCGELQIWLADAGRPAQTLIKSIPGPERPPA